MKKEIIVNRYAIIWEGGSVQNLIFETNDKNTYMIAFSEIEKEDLKVNDERFLRRKVVEAIDKDLTITLKCADRLFKWAEYDRELKEKENAKEVLDLYL